MKLILKKNVLIEGRRYLAGTVIERDQMEAEDLIDRGLADSPDDQVTIVDDARIQSPDEAFAAIPDAIEEDEKPAVKRRTATKRTTR